MTFPDVSRVAPGADLSHPPLERDQAEAADTVVKPVLQLVAELCQGLADEGISYCHWKSNNALDRSASGENDLDLLVSRADMSRFSSLLARLGFKEAIAGPEKAMIGALDYYGHDRPSGRLVHVHAHYQLVMGHDMTKNFRLPVESAYLGSAVQAGLFRFPAAEFEFIVLVIRMILKHSTWDVIIGRDGRLKKSERAELDDLQTRIVPSRIREIVEGSLPYVGVELFDACVAALRPGAPLLFRARTGQQLQQALQANTRQPLGTDVLQKLWHRAIRVIKRRITKSGSRHRLASGGALIAIVGGDGAGKTTAVERLHSWLSRDFDAIRVHLGKPRESPTTRLIRALLRLGQLLGLYPHLNSASPYLAEASQEPSTRGRLPWMIREACKARDRYAAYLKARRFVNAGGIVICDRFPLPQISLMDGPVVERIAGGATGQLVKFLIEFERRQYQRITPPELVMVLRLNPEEAVRRKTEEDPAQVRARSTEIWQADWSGGTVHLIDAGRSPDEVIAAVKSLVWSQL
jgi:thymidylate kinase